MFVFAKLSSWKKRKERGDGWLFAWRAERAVRASHLDTVTAVDGLDRDWDLAGHFCGCLIYMTDIKLGLMFRTWSVFHCRRQLTEKQTEAEAGPLIMLNYKFNIWFLSVFGWSLEVLYIYKIYPCSGSSCVEGQLSFQENWTLPPGLRVQQEDTNSQILLYPQAVNAPSSDRQHFSTSKITFVQLEVHHPPLSHRLSNISAEHYYYFLAWGGCCSNCLGWIQT